MRGKEIRSEVSNTRGGESNKWKEFHCNKRKELLKHQTVFKMRGKEIRSEVSNTRGGERGRKYCG